MANLLSDPLTVVSELIGRKMAKDFDRLIARATSEVASGKRKGIKMAEKAEKVVMRELLPKDLLEGLESGDRTAEVIKAMADTNPDLGPTQMFGQLDARNIQDLQRMQNQLAQFGQVSSVAMSGSIMGGFSDQFRRW